MSLATPNMQDCNKKERCLSGPNAGLAYIPGSECPEGFAFNEADCDCDQIFDCNNCTGDQLVVYWKAYYKERSTACVDQTSQGVCEESGEADLSLTITIPGLISGQVPKWIDNYDVSDTTTPSCGGPDMRGAVRVWRCVNGVAEPMDVVLGFPGCTVNGLQRGIPEYIIGGGKYITIGNVLGKSGWMYVSHALTDIKYYQGPGNCGLGGTFGAGEPYYTTIAGRWKSVTALKLTNACGGYYWRIIGIDCYDQESVIELVDLGGTGFYGIGEGTKTLEIVAPA